MADPPTVPDSLFESIRFDALADFLTNGSVVVPISGILAVLAAYFTIRTVWRGIPVVCHTVKRVCDFTLTVYGIIDETVKTAYRRVRVLLAWYIRPRKKKHEPSAK